MKGVFADTFYWAALTKIDDPAHTRAMELSRSITPHEIVTTDEVLSEYLTFFAAAPEHLRRKAAVNAQDILKDATVRVIPQSHESFLDGLELYGSRPDKGYSLVDCISAANHAQRRIDRHPH